MPSGRLSLFRYRFFVRAIESAQQGLTMSATEPKDLDALVATYQIDTVWEQYKRFEVLEKLKKYVDLRTCNALELGSATGHLTEQLAKVCKSVVAVDGSQRFLDIARKNVRSGSVQFIHARFEELALKDSFDLVVMHHVLEHLERPEPVLQGIRKLVRDSGILVLSVPNAHALSRQLAVRMGLLESLYALTENDHKHRHHRGYDWQTSEHAAQSAGYSVVGRHGLSMKLFADFQVEKSIQGGIIGDAQLRGLWPLADEYRNVAGAMMLVLNKV